MADPSIRRFEDLIAWQRAFRLALEVIRAVRVFPAEERFALAMQMRRSAVSVPSNIAEGFGRGTRTDYIRFLYIARGSLFELNTQSRLAQELTYFQPEQAKSITDLIDETERVLCGLIRALERNAG